MPGNIASVLSLDSKFRDRTRFPLISEFEVDFSVSGERDKFTAYDPVSDSAPIITIRSGSFRNDISSASLSTGTLLTTGIGTSNTGTTFYLTTPAGQLRTEDNFYIGASISLTNGGTTETRRITEYKFMGTGDTGCFTVTPAFGDAVIAAGTTSTLTNPTDTTLTNQPSYFIPSGAGINNFYNEKILDNITRGETRTITSYNGESRIATLNTPAGTWLFSDEVILRCEPVCNTGAIQNINGTNIQLPLNSSNIMSNYVGGFFRIASPAPVAPFSTVIAPYGETRRIVQHYAFDTSFQEVLALGNTFTLPFNDTSRSVDFTGAWFQITSGAGTGTNFQVASYNTTTRSGTITTTFPAGVAPNDTLSFRSIRVASPYSVAPLAGVNYEVLCFTRDNAVPVVYNGTITSASQAVCYEVELKSLILPNVVLNSLFGGRLSFYRQVLVTLSNITAPENKYPMMTNNPYASKHNASFVVPINDVTVPTLSSFVRIDGAGITQTMKIRITDGWKLEVRTPAGNLITTELAETFGPLPTNPEIQISATFSLKRLAPN